MKKSRQSPKFEKTENSRKYEVIIHFHTRDLERSNNLTNRFKQHLNEYDNVTVSQVKNSYLPKGAMPSDVFTIGALAIVVLPTLLPAIINAIKDVKLKNKGTSINIKVKDGDKEIELGIPSDSISIDEITALTDKYLEKLKK